MTDTTTHIAIFDCGAGFLQWIGEATSHEAAIKRFDTDIGLRAAIEIEIEDDPNQASLEVYGLTPDQAAWLTEWHESGSLEAWGDRMDDPTTYTAVEVLAILNGEEGVKQ